MKADNKFSIPERWEYVLPALAIASLLISCVVISSKKFFWNDELYSYYLLADQSFTHMMGAFHDKINNTPPLYFLLGWLWVRLFGSTELSLRLFSSLGMCVACATIWITLRRTYNFWSASIGTLAVFCTSSIILSQNVEARMYGLFLAVCSLALLHYDSINRNLKPNWKRLFPNAFVHAAIVNTHIFGLFYSGAIAFSLIVRDKYINSFRPKVYLSIVLGWLSLILYIPSFLNQADAGNPRTWIPLPDLRNLIDVLTTSLFSFERLSIPSLFKLAILLVLVLITGQQFFAHKIDDTLLPQRAKRNRQNLSSELSLLIVAYAFLGVPVFIWIISHTIKPVFWDRYLIPSVLSWSILIAYATAHFIPEIGRRLKLSSLVVATSRSILFLGLTAILLSQPISYAKSVQKEQFPGLNDNKYGYKELPIAMQFSHDFLKRFHYSSERARYFFILDWEIALDKTSGLFPTQEYKHLTALKRNYPNLFQNHIINGEEFLETYNRFLVLTPIDYANKCSLEAKLENLHCSRWLEMRIMSNSRYQVTFIGEIDSRKLWLVER